MIRWVRANEIWPRVFGVTSAAGLIAYFGTREHRWRKYLVGHANGNVLEMAVGGGHNFKYYDKKRIASITALDNEEVVLDLAKSREREVEPIPLKLVLSSAQRTDFDDCSFDTVLDTYGVCAYEAPLEALMEMRRLVKPDGYILLLEHGKSSWPFASCCPNFNIRNVVRKAGLEVILDKQTYVGEVHVLLVCRKEAS